MLNTNLNKYLLADLFSQFAAGMTIIAINWNALEVSGSNQLVANISNVNIISGFLTAILAGVLVDRFQQRLIIKISLILRILFILCPLILWSLYGANRYIFYIAALSNGIGWNLYFPASKSLLQKITREKDLVKINSKAEIVMQVGLFSAGAFAGSIYKFLGLNIVLSISVILFLASILLIQKINIDEEIISLQVKKENYLASFKDGVSYLFNNKKTFVLGIVMYIPFVAASLLNTILPGYIGQILQADAFVYGCIDALYGIGACIAGLIVIGLIKKYSYNKVVYISFSLCILCGVFLFVNNTIVGAALAVCMLGIGGPAIRTIVYSIIMKIVPNNYLGRTMSVWNSINLVIQALATYFIGRISDNIGVSYGFDIYAGIMILGIIIYISIHRQKQTILKSNLLCQE